jgi:hypothetical protein
MITKEDYEELIQCQNSIDTALETAEKIIKSSDGRLYERWVAYGKQVNNQFISMGPSLQDVIETLGKEIDNED